jgi:hypothetical protein
VVVMRLALAVALLAPSFAAADPACLPKALFPKDVSSAAELDLGLVAGVPTLCAAGDYDHGGMLGCWAVDAKTGALSNSTATALPGHSLYSKADAKGCVEGYCVPKLAADERVRWATSTDGAHAVVLREQRLFLFDAKTKKQTGTIDLQDEKAPDNTNVGSEPIQILYAGNTLYVVGTDAGPYIAVWAYKDDGKRLGVLGGSGDGFGFSVFAGSRNLIDDGHLLLADAGWQHVRLIAAADNKTIAMGRPLSSKPCTSEELQLLTEGEPSKGCRKTIAKVFEPYMGLVPVALPSGEYLALMDGKNRGSVAIVDAAKLTQKKPIKLKRCAK